jgi:hypothetical protein
MILKAENSSNAITLHRFAGKARRMDRLAQRANTGAALQQRRSARTDQELTEHANG